MLASFLNHCFDEYGLKSYSAESAGMVEREEVVPATGEAIAVMREQCLDIAIHRSCSLSQVDLPSYDVIYALSADVYQHLLSLELPEAQVILLQPEVANPWQKGLKEYRMCRDQILTFANEVAMDIVYSHQEVVAK